MIKLFALLFSPFKTWMAIAERNRSAGAILLLFALPLAVFCCGIEGASLARWGERRGGFDSYSSVSRETVIRYAATQAALFIVCAVVGAFALQTTARSFHLPTTFRQAFTAFAYSLSPLMLGRLLDAIPALNTWICWAIGVSLAISFLYHGVALVVRPEQTKGFGLFLISSIIALFSTGVAHLLAITVLHGKLLR